MSPVLAEHSVARTVAAPAARAAIGALPPVQAVPSVGSDAGRDDARRRRRVRAIFISDVHLGTAGCKAEHLLDFLRHHESDWLYLVGDIAIREEAEHRLLDGRRLWVVHGDFADGVIRNAKWLAHVGDALYDFILWLNRHFNTLRARLGFSYWSLSQYLKHSVKNAVSFITDFEHVLMREARRRGFDGVVCGHIHQAEIREIDGLLYCNDGDWVESLTAIVETCEGKLEVVTWNHKLGPHVPVPRWDDSAVDIDGDGIPDIPALAEVAGR